MTDSQALQDIKQYYTNIDDLTSVKERSFCVNTQVLPSIMNLFAEEASYLRDGYPVFEGKQAIQEFFSSNRSLCGTHHVDAITELDDSKTGVKTITVRGRYEGTRYLTKPNEEKPSTRSILKEFPANLDFTDSWSMKDGKVFYRQSDITPSVDILRNGRQLAY